MMYQGEAFIFLIMCIFMFCVHTILHKVWNNENYYVLCCELEPTLLLKQIEIVTLQVLSFLHIKCIIGRSSMCALELWLHLRTKPCTHHTGENNLKLFGERQQGEIYTITTWKSIPVAKQIKLLCKLSH